MAFRNTQCYLHSTSHHDPQASHRHLSLDEPSIVTLLVAKSNVHFSGILGVYIHTSHSRTRHPFACSRISLPWVTFERSIPNHPLRMIWIDLRNTYALPVGFS